MLCQLQGLEDAVIELSIFEKFLRAACLRWIDLIRRITPGRGGRCPKNAVEDNLSHDMPLIPPLHLKAGERVRVKSADEIKKTLDANHKYQGLSYTPVMWKYCGGVYTVYKRVDKVFDERKWKLSKVKNIVLLDGVFCDGAGGIEKAWDGCDRACFIWWKEGWLERIHD